MPLSRARFAQRLANPLLSAWGIIWTPEETTEYTVAREILETGAWLGSPFQQVVTDRSMLHKSLIGLDPDRDHITYHELAAVGGTDFFAMALEYGDGSAQRREPSGAGAHPGRIDRRGARAGAVNAWGHVPRLRSVSRDGGGAGGVIHDGRAPL